MRRCARGIGKFWRLALANILNTTPKKIYIELGIDPADFRALVEASGGSQFALRSMRLTANRWIRQLEHEARRQASPPSVARHDAAEIPF